MTAIVWDGNILATDSAVSCGEFKGGRAQKIFKLKDGRYLAGSGHYKDVQMAIYYLNIGKFPLHVGQELESFEGVIIDENKQAWRLENNLLAYKVHSKIVCAGSGLEVCTAALYCGKDSINAIKVASKVLAHIDDDVQYIHFLDGDRKISSNHPWIMELA